MEEEDVEKLYSLLDEIERKEGPSYYIKEIREDLGNEDYQSALQKIMNIQKRGKEEKEEEEDDPNINIMTDEQREELEDEELEELTYSKDGNKKQSIYPKKLRNEQLEQIYIGMLLNYVKSISMYYFIFDDCYFENDKMLNIYKSVLFTEGEAYAPETAKRGFNFAKESDEMNMIKMQLREDTDETKYNFEKIYVNLRKLFVLRKNYLGMPIKNIQDKIVEIVDYELYEKMTIEEVEAAVEQVTVTGKFKKAILNENLTQFLVKRDNNLTNGLPLPFPILSSVFKGLRTGETMSFAMPSNSGKSRFTIDIAAYIAFIHKKKVLVISNEMSEEKMKLCLITTIINNPEIQKLHGQILKKTEGELLEFKFRPDDKNINVDKDGFITKEENETQAQFVRRLSKISTEFNKTIMATDWLNKQINNSIYFINITDHTNDELHKVMVNYYYKEKIEYMFYDTMKTDTENIGNGEELKKTATIFSNLAQDFNIFIGSTLQLTETATLPINLNISDLAVSRTVKEVLDTLCLMKQIQRDDLEDYQYSKEEVDTKFFDLEKLKDPDVRYYACVVDKNRAGAKPKVLFRLNLAYNIWEEIGYLQLKVKKDK